MDVTETEPLADESHKQIRVRLPVELILRLQELRIREGKRTGEVVRSALEDYFEKMREERSPRPH